jgi:hypothetical protein
MLPDEVYEEVSKGALKAITHQFIKDFEQYFGRNNAFYNLHILYHVPDMRERKGPLTSTSCYPFEASYAWVKDAQKTGTESLGKQSIKGVLSRYVAMQSSHKCVTGMKIRTRETTKTDDTIVATSVNEFLKVTLIEGDSVTGKIIVTDDFAPRMTSDPNDWKKIGVRNVVCISEETRTVPRASLFGKGVICDGVITSMSMNILRDH